MLKVKFQIEFFSVLQNIHEQHFLVKFNIFTHCYPGVTLEDDGVLICPYITPLVKVQIHATLVDKYSLLVLLSKHINDIICKYGIIILTLKGCYLKDVIMVVK